VRRTGQQRLVHGGILERRPRKSTAGGAGVTEA
jgi:hypothetical protein